MAWKMAARDALDRPVLRWLLIPLGVVRLTMRERVPSFVWPTKDGWVHWYPGGTFTAATLGMPKQSGLDRNTEDVFLYACQLRPGDTVVDVGAGVGEEIGTFSRLVGSTGRVIGLEAHPVTFSFLRRNCARAGLANVELVQRAVSNRSGVVLLADDGANVANRVTRQGKTVTVAASSLDELAVELNIGRVALMKMNIEGSERLAIEGMHRLIQRTDNVAISCHDFLAESEEDESLKTKQVVRTFLEEQGFLVHSRDHDPRPWVRDSLYGSRQRS